MTGNEGGVFASLTSWTEKAICASGRAPAGKTKGSDARRPPAPSSKAEAEAELAAAIKASLVESPPHLDMTVVCHETRGLDLASGQQAYVSVSDLRCGDRPGEVTYRQLGAACNLMTLELDTTLLLRICVDENSEGPGSTGRANAGQRRILGEVRVPLPHVIKNYSSCLYYTWVALEMPGLHDSVASLGDFTGGDGSALDLAINQGPKQLSQPRACISVCKSSDIGATGKVIWSPDTPAEARTALWGPLIRSQQQHVVLSAALHLKCERQGQHPSTSQGYSSSSQSSKALGELQDQTRAHEQENTRLKAQLESTQSQLQLAQSQLKQRSLANVEDLGTSPLPSPRRLTNPGSGASEREQLQAALAELEVLRRENNELNLELGVVSTEANEKIEEANDRIRTMRLRHQEAADVNHKLSDQNIQLTEQNKVLRCICEDLKRKCEERGLQIPDHSMLVADELDNTVRNLSRPDKEDLDLSFG